MRKLFAVSVIVAMCAAACISYDQPVIYHKNFQPGTHTLLRCDGYYTPEWDMNMTERVKPVYFYSNGSVWFGEELCQYNVVNESVKKGLAHSWGNYKIAGDTIYIERFQKKENSDNYNRVTLKGVISTDNIKWVQREEDRMNPVAVSYTTIFKANSYKPDSTQNWTRTRVQYNK